MKTLFIILILAVFPSVLFSTCNPGDIESWGLQNNVVGDCVGDTLNAAGSVGFVTGTACSTYPYNGGKFGAGQYYSAYGYTAAQTRSDATFRMHFAFYMDTHSNGPVTYLDGPGSNVVAIRVLSAGGIRTSCDAGGASAADNTSVSLSDGVCYRALLIKNGTTQALHVSVDGGSFVASVTVTCIATTMPATGYSSWGAYWDGAANLFPLNGGIADIHVSSFLEQPTSTSTHSPTPTLTHTFSPTITQTFTDSPTFTVTLTRTPTPTFTATPTWTPTRTHTPTWTQTITETFTGTFTVTPTFTATPTWTLTRTPTPTFTITLTRTPTRTATLTFSPSATPTPVCVYGGNQSVGAKGFPSSNMTVLKMVTGTAGTYSTGYICAHISYTAGANNYLIAAVYSSSSSRPYRLLHKTKRYAVTATGWKCLPIDYPTLGNINYWISVSSRYPVEYSTTFTGGDISFPGEQRDISTQERLTNLYMNMSFYAQWCP